MQVVGPIASRYRWQGKIEQAQEWQCLAKTEASRYPEVEAAISEIHSYDEPEIVATPIVAGSRRLPGLGQRERALSSSDPPLEEAALRRVRGELERRAR